MSGKLGENTHELEDGLITTIDGTFMAGVNGDKPGIIMKAHPAIGDFYRQEFSLNNAEDFAETRSLTQTVHVPSWDVPQLPEIERDHALGNRPPRIQVLRPGRRKYPDGRCQNRRQGWNCVRIRRE